MTKQDKSKKTLYDTRKGDRHISASKYVVAFVITLIIFLLGTAIGFFVEEKRVNYIQNTAEQQRHEFESLQLQYEYINKLKNENNCPAVLEAFKYNIQSLEKSREKLEGYEQDAQITKDSIEDIKRRYVLAQVRFWLLAKDTKDICNNTFTDVLYFYGTKEECPQCESQAMVLNNLKNIFKEDLLIFAFDGELENEPLITLIKKTYNIESYPRLIINDKAYEGFVSREELIGIICDTNNDTETWVCRKN
jgi:hypothetical protein